MLALERAAVFLGVLVPPVFEERTDEEFHVEMLRRCRRNRRRALAYRVAVWRLYPRFIRKRREKAIWIEAFRLLAKYRSDWKESRRMRRNILKSEGRLGPKGINRHGIWMWAEQG